MGQRLVIYIKSNGETVANAYYHWGAYTGSAIEYVKQILDYYNNNENVLNEMRIGPKAVMMLQATGAGIPRGEIVKGIKELSWFNFDQTASELGYKTDHNDYAYQISSGRNDGLIAITQKGIGDLEYASEGDVYIDLDDKTVDIGVIDFYDVEELDYYYENEDLDKDYAENLPVLDYDPCSLTFSGFYDFYNDVSQLDGFKDIDGNVYTFIG